MSIIRQLRKRAGMTQQELAEQIGHTDGWINHLENGRRLNFTFEDGVKMAHLFRISPEALDQALKTGIIPEAETTSTKA